jgi:hypothetical protein
LRTLVAGAGRPASAARQLGEQDVDSRHRTPRTTFPVTVWTLDSVVLRVA